MEVTARRTPAISSINRMSATLVAPGVDVALAKMPRVSGRRRHAQSGQRLAHIGQVLVVERQLEIDAAVTGFDEARGYRAVDAVDPQLEQRTRGRGERAGEQGEAGRQLADAALDAAAADGHRRGRVEI